MGAVRIQLDEESKKKLAEMIKNVVDVSDEEADELAEIIATYHPKKIITAVNQVTMVSWKHRGKKRKIPLKEFKKILRKVRF